MKQLLRIFKLFKQQIKEKKTTYFNQSYGRIAYGEARLKNGETAKKGHLAWLSGNDEVTGNPIDKKTPVGIFKSDCKSGGLAVFVLVEGL